MCGALTAGADDLGPEGFDPAFGWGRLNMERALLAAARADCYANCDHSTVEPVLNAGDFSCFLSRFSAGDPWANCDGGTVPPLLNVSDFSCFMARYAHGCGGP